MRTERLLKLADHLDNLPTYRRLSFTMEHWFHGANEPYPVCGTACCALGEATTIPEFREAGLTAANRGWMDAMIPTYEPALTDRYFDLDAGKTLTGYRAACAFFDIDYDLAFKLFSPDYYQRKEAREVKVVSDRLRQAVTQYEQSREREHDNLGADL